MSKKIKTCEGCLHSKSVSGSNWSSTYHCAHGKEMSDPDPVYGNSYQKYSWLPCWVLRSKLFYDLFQTCGPRGQYFVDEKQ